MAQLANFYGYDFEAEYLLFADEFEEIPAVYVIYTPKVCLDVGQTENLKEGIETHGSTKDWVKQSNSDDIYVAFYHEPDRDSRVEIESLLRSKMKPVVDKEAL